MTMVLSIDVCVKSEVAILWPAPSHVTLALLPAGRGIRLGLTVASPPRRAAPFARVRRVPACPAMPFWCGVACLLTVRLAPAEQGESARVALPSYDTFLSLSPFPRWLRPASIASIRDSEPACRARCCPGSSHPQRRFAVHIGRIASTLTLTLVAPCLGLAAVTWHYACEARSNAL